MHCAHAAAWRCAINSSHYHVYLAYANRNGKIGMMHWRAWRRLAVYGNAFGGVSAGRLRSIDTSSQVSLKMSDMRRDEHVIAHGELGEGISPCRRHNENIYVAAAAIMSCRNVAPHGAPNRATRLRAEAGRGA